MTRDHDTLHNNEQIGNKVRLKHLFHIVRIIAIIPTRLLYFTQMESRRITCLH